MVGPDSWTDRKSEDGKDSKPDTEMGTTTYKDCH